MLLSNTTGSLTGAVPLSVDFDSPVDYFVFIFQILFATAAVLIAGTVVIGISATRALRLQNRMNAVCTPAVYLWGSPALREATVRTVWGRVCPRCRRRLGSCHRKDQSKGDGNNKNRRSPFSKWF
uniref:uncharacterized protein LOC124058576 isoform X2 n=1 Tax=Scatophagus argus TaxID=75038 RepID=UPI001ED81B00|nr:uncharacterized protein LOC124058576 isoform X2 [Scatophagus argus]